MYQHSTGITSRFWLLVPEPDTTYNAGNCNEKQSQMISSIAVWEVVFGVKGVEVEGVLEVLEGGVLKRRSFVERGRVGRGLTGAQGPLVKQRV